MKIGSEGVGAIILVQDRTQWGPLTHKHEHYGMIKYGKFRG
jgi:hypothetical protein